jgi:hypothetical protein
VLHPTRRQQTSGRTVTEGACMYRVKPQSMLRSQW